MSMPEAAAPADEQAEAARELLGKVISERYRVDEVLGTGGMGAVYRAEHLLMHKRVAIKVLHPEMTRLPEVVQRFEREAMAAGHIEHPNVATAYDFGKLDNGSCFLVLEFVEGKSLRDVMLEEGSLAPERSVHITRQILQGLARAHEKGIVHRDLKPENIMLVQRDGDPNFVKVLDFGIAKVPVGQLAEASAPAGPGRAQTKALTQLGMVYGTPEYMAPEQALGQEVDLRADLYAVGVMLFEMLIGERPFNAPSPVQILGMVMSKPVPAFAEVAPDKMFPPGLEDFTRKLLAKVPDERYPDARAALAGLEALLPGPVSMGSSGGWPQMPVTARGASLTSPGGHGALDTSMRVAEPPAARSSLKLPPALAALPRPALIGGGVGLVALLLGLMMLLRGDDKKTGTALVPSGSASADIVPEPPPPPKITDEDVKEATGKGVEALEALRTKAPSDPRVLRALSKAQADGKQTAAALKTLEELAAVDKEGMAERPVRSVVVQLALAEKDPSAVLTAAQEKLGFAGPDAFYELLTHPKASPALKKKANELLTKSQDNASPALKTALGLRKIVSSGKQGICGQAPALKALFSEAKEHGDSRSTPFLNPLTDNKGCGFFLRKTDCYACIRGDNSLYEALSKIREREKADK